MTEAPANTLGHPPAHAAREMAPALSCDLQRKLTRVERKHAERIRRLRESERLAALAEGDPSEFVPRCRVVCR